MTEEELKALISKQESESLDYKSGLGLRLDTTYSACSSAANSLASLAVGGSTRMFRTSAMVTDS